MQCSCCRNESESLREYSRSAFDAEGRKTIQTLQLCAICRIVQVISPRHVLLRASQPARPLARARAAAAT